MCKKYIFTFFVFILSILCFQDTYSSCQYSQEIKSCHAANQSDSTREIQDFVCLADKWNPQYYTYQIILDKRFQAIDEQVEKYLSDLETNKWFYFGNQKQQNFVDGVKNITNIFQPTGEFWKQYMQACSNIAQEVLSCQQDETLKDIYPNKTSSVEIWNALDYYPSANTDCVALTNQKLDIYKQVWFDILYLNKTAISTDSLKLYQQDQRSSYDKLLSKFMINLWYVERIWAKWPAKIKNTSG